MRKKCNFFFELFIERYQGVCTDSVIYPKWISSI